MSRVRRVIRQSVRGDPFLATYPDPRYCEGMANAETVVGYEFHQGFYADLERRHVLQNGEQLETPLTLKQFEVLVFSWKIHRR